MKMKKLNRKGFTLIELLAVIVILAIVMGIAANSVLNSINNSRVSSLYSTAQNMANTLNTWVTEDSLEINDNKRHLGNKFVKYTQDTKKNTWVCLKKDANVEKIVNRAGTAAATADATPGVSLLAALNVSENDIVIGTSATLTKETASADPSCSAIRYNTTTGAYEILLVAKSGGKHYVANDKFHYAYSTASSYNTPATNA